MNPSTLTMLGMMTLGAAACGGSDCPSPRFAGTPSVTWGTASSTQALVIRWAASQGDPLPALYYQTATVEAETGDGGYARAWVTDSSTPYQLTVEVAGLGTSPPPLTLRFEFPDTMQFTSCSHPGMGDAYFVRVHVNFETATHTATATFGEASARRGGCSVVACPETRPPWALLWLGFALWALRSRSPRDLGGRHHAARQPSAR